MEKGTLTAERTVTAFASHPEGLGHPTHHQYLCPHHTQKPTAKHSAALLPREVGGFQTILRLKPEFHSRIPNKAQLTPCLSPSLSCWVSV